MRELWYRACVDLDRHGQVVGISYETRQGEVVTGTTCVAIPGPFDTPVEAFEQVLDTLPIQMRLFT